MRIILFVCVILQMLSCDGCLASQKQEAKNPISFTAFAKLVSGTLTKAELTKLFGKPTEVIDFKKLPESKETGESWKYDRFTFFFDEGSEITNTWVWDVKEGEPEQDLKTAMSRYAPTSWEPETDKWINPHNFPNECYFKDKKKGVSIEYNRARKEVFSIARWDPSRKIASLDKNEKPPQFCIGNSCTPGMSSKEFFKEFPISKYCEIPK